MEVVKEPSPFAYALAPLIIPVWITYQALYYTTSAVEFSKEMINTIKKNMKQTLESKVDLINSSNNSLDRN